MFAGLGGEVAEPSEDLDANATLQLRVGLNDIAQPRIKVLALVSELQHECLVVETCGHEVDLWHREVDESGEEAVRVAHRMAQPDHAIKWAARVDRPGQHRHRVTVIEQVCVGGHLGQVFADLGHHWDRAQSAEDSADADGVRDGLADPILCRDVEVRAGRAVSADLDLVHHVVRAFDGRQPVDARDDIGAGATLATDPLGQRIGVPEPLGVDVVQRQLKIPV